MNFGRAKCAMNWDKNADYARMGYVEEANEVFELVDLPTWAYPNWY